MLRHIWPNIVPLVVANAFLTSRTASSTLSALSFLGLGVRAGRGRLGADAHRGTCRSSRTTRSRRSRPALAIVLTAASMNLSATGSTSGCPTGGARDDAADRPRACGSRAGSVVGRADDHDAASTSTSRPGEAVGIVGESGSGKSMTARAIVGLLPRGVRADGRVEYAGRDAARRARTRRSAALRGAEIALIFQDPFTMLNPLMRCGAQIVELLRDARGRRLRPRRARAPRPCAGWPRSASTTRPWSTRTRSSSRAACASASASPPRSRATRSC